MRRPGFVCALLLYAASACSDDGDGVDIDATAIDGPPPGAPDADLTPDGDSSPDAGPPTGMAPNITLVTWEPMGSCAMGTPSNYRITTTVNDPDTATGMLSFSGSATSCTGAIDGIMVTVNCPNAAAYPANVTVTDPQGNTDAQGFTINVCTSGSAP